MKKLTTNPILEELWQVRAQIEAEYGGDLDKYSEDLEKEFQTGKPRVVVVSDAIRKRAEKAMKPKYDKLPRNPILDEIRATRAKIVREFDYDMDKLCDHLAAEGKAEGRVYVNMKPRRIKSVPASAKNSIKQAKPTKKVSKRKRSA